MSFCHLHVHSEYSQLDGLGTSEQYVERAKKIGQKYLSITDHGNIDGVIKHQQACEKHEIIPIIGCEAYLVKNAKKKIKEEKRGHITLWAKNWEGWKNITSMLTSANLNGFYYKPRISHDILLEHLSGIVVGTACISTFINKENGIRLLKTIKDTIKDDLYLEIMPHKYNPQITLNRQLLKLSKTLDIKIIATNDCHYIKKSDWKAHEVLLGLQTGAKWDDPKRFKFPFKGLHLRSKKEMKESLKEIGFYKEKYLMNTLEVAEKCENFKLDQMKIKLPRIQGIKLGNESNFLLDLCLKSWDKKFDGKIPDIYNDRIKKEYRIIKKKKFIRYFLIFWELLKWCRENDIMIGPGRGSVCGSLIAFLLDIHDVDPIKFGLLFERFIAEDRIDYPDIDIDFEHTKRHIVRERLESIYGENKISAVSSFNKMRSKAVIKDVARFFRVPDFEVNNFTKLIDTKADDSIQLTIDSYKEGQEFENSYPNVIKYAKKLEGQIRNYGKHAAGIVISREPIADTGRCNMIERDNATLINWEKDDAEFMGLMKLDILGLKLLSTLAEVIKLIKENHDKELVLTEINLEDPKILKEINEGNTAGAFQISTYATLSIIKEIGIEKFSDIAAIESLARPGPTKSGITEEYIERKRTKKWERKNKIYENITKETLGVPIYQEQIMAIIYEVAGLPYSTADKIRKIIGKKRDHKEFEKYKLQFIRGCKKKKIFSLKEAKEFWEKLQEWARYGFNKSHAIAYSILGYWCVWLKYYYPTEFICASLSFCAKDKKSELVEEAYRKKLIVIPPKIGISKSEKWVAKKNKLYIPFIEIKGIGETKAKEISSNKMKKGIKKFYTKKLDKKEIQKHQKGLSKLLDSIDAYDPNERKQLSKEAQKLFQFRVINNPRDAYKNLFKLLGDIKIKELDAILSGNTKIIGKYLDKSIIKKTSFRKHGPQLHTQLNNCKRCELRDECISPVLPSPGIYNIFIIGEAPGPEEDNQGECFVHKSGSILWKGLEKYKMEREIFHVTNINKCYPSKSGRPNTDQIKACSKFIKKEIRKVKPKIIFALGNTTRYFFTGQKSGIMNVSGKIQWIEEYAAWICWGVHPAAALHNTDNQIYVDNGIRSFAKFFNKMRSND